MAALEQDILATRQLQLVGERLAAEWVHCQWDVDKLDRTTMYPTPVVFDRVRDVQPRFQKACKLSNKEDGK